MRIAIKTDDRYVLSLCFHKKSRYKQVRRNELEVDEPQFWSIVEIKGKNADEKLSEYLYEAIEKLFKLPKHRRFNRFSSLMQKLGFTFDDYDYIDEDIMLECSYITYGIHPLSCLASNIHTISVKDLK